MEEKVNVPDMGEGVETATVVGILVAVGDSVQADQGLIEMETEKAVAEMPSPRAGTVKAIHVEEGQEIEIGTLVVTLETAGEGAKAEKKPAPAKKKEEKPPAAEEEAEPRPEAQEQAPPPGKPRRQAPPAEEAPPRFDTGRSILEGVPAAPYVRRLAREVGVDLRRVSGSGEGGWITEQDVKAAARRGAAAAPGEAGDRDAYGPVRRERMARIRRAIAEKMHESHTQVARVTNIDDADVTDLEALRAEHRSDLEGIRLTMLPFVVRAVAAALKAHPLVNASLDMEAGQIVYKDYVNIGIAVDSDRGLIVPVLRGADRLSIAEIARAVDWLAGEVRSADFDLSLLRGGTFTITNLGSIGGQYATPVVNTPESAILLIGRGGPRPVVRDGQIVVRTLLPLSLSYDHRLIDGAEAARFLNDVVASLEDPGRLLLR
ncbi:MAG: 2-oxo acid dehydrogenase subunit E2 [Planctomycetes bacterium]|nr:2-oxo acid dehydrogenase subunit E2 [Planctomycetota bacterium]